MNEDMRNMFLAIGVSLLLVFAVQTFLPQIFPSLGPEPEPQVAPEQAGGDSGESNAGGLTVTGTDGESVASIVTRDTALDGNDRIGIDTGVLTGSLNLTGAVFDDLTLTGYRQSVDPTSPFVDLLHPQNSRGGYNLSLIHI